MSSLLVFLSTSSLPLYLQHVIVRFCVPARPGVRMVVAGSGVVVASAFAKDELWAQVSEQRNRQQVWRYFADLALTKPLTRIDVNLHFGEKTDQMLTVYVVKKLGLFTGRCIHLKEGVDYRWSDGYPYILDCQENCGNYTCSYMTDIPTIAQLKPHEREKKRVARLKLWGVDVRGGQITYTHLVLRYPSFRPNTLGSFSPCGRYFVSDYGLIRDCRDSVVLRQSDRKGVTTWIDATTVGFYILYRCVGFGLFQIYDVPSGQHIQSINVAGLEPLSWNCNHTRFISGRNLYY